MPFRISKFGQHYAVIDTRTGQVRFMGSLAGARQAQAHLTAQYRAEVARDMR